MEGQYSDNKFLNAISGFFTGWRFPVFTIGILAFFNLMMLFFLSIPPSETGFGEFARDFKTWCFNYDPASGRTDYVYTIVMVTQPLLLAVIIYYIWRDQIALAWTKHRAGFLRLASASLTIVLCLGVGFTLIVGRETTKGEYPFPAERLRTELEPPQFTMVNQDGDEISLESLRGKVVVVTGVYATCSGSCPVILTELTRVTSEMSEEELAEIAVVAITLDPENDDQRARQRLAARHQVSAPTYNFVNADPDHVNETLDRFSISRISDEESGEIDHTNLYVLIDRNGKIAYRLALSERTSEWMTTALQVLLGGPSS